MADKTASDTDNQQTEGRDWSGVTGWDSGKALHMSLGQIIRRRERWRAAFALASLVIKLALWALMYRELRRVGRADVPRG